MQVAPAAARSSIFEANAAVLLRLTTNGSPERMARRRGLTPVPEPVRDRVPPVAAEILPGDLHAGCGLPPLVFSDVEQVLDAHHGRAKRFSE